MDTNGIHYIIAVAECGSISAAGRKLFLSQPALTKQISRLEEQIGIKIFDRQKTPIQVTAEGEAFLEFAEKYAELERELMAQIGKKQQGIERVCIATTERGGFYAGKRTASFLVEHPDAQLEYLHLSAQRCEAALEDETAELAIYTDPVISDKLEYMPLEEDPLVLVIPRNHPLVAGRDLSANSLSHLLPLNLEELRNADLTYILSPEAHSLHYAEKGFLKKYRITPAHSFQVDFVNTRYAVACGGGGAVLVPFQTVENGSAGNVALCTVAGEQLYRYVIIARKKGRTLSRGAESLWRYFVGQRFQRE